VICHMPWSLSVFGGAVKNAGQRLGFWAHAYHNGGGWLEHLARRTSPDLDIANSRFTGRGLANLFPATPQVVVHPPVTLAPLRDAAQTRALLREQLGVTEETVVIIQVSRIEACKGHLAHLQALAQLKGLSTPWVCWMAGGAQRPEERDYLRELQETAASLGLEGRVRFLGQRSDVPELLAAADIFCQPNQTPDSFGITFIEALGAGRPVITSALGGALEIIDQSSGFLVQPGDVTDLAGRLAELIEQPRLRARFVHSGAMRAIELCDPGRQINLLAQACIEKRRVEA
jgi:glycosyltransferase involved in cell wall biosynthesis